MPSGASSRATTADTLRTPASPRAHQFDVMGTIRAMTRTAHLRAYLPMAEFSRLESHVPGEGGMRQSRFGLISEAPVEDGLVAEWNGERFMCPRTVRLRVLQGVLAFHNAYEENGGHLLIPEQTARLAAVELERLQRDRPDMRAHILTSAWHVPPRWFLAFASDEREVLDGDPVTVRYRTQRLLAGARLRRVLAALHGAGFAEAVTAEIKDLADWVEAFPEGAMLELDFGTVAQMFSPQDLVTDDSAEEIWASVQALERGDFAEARSLYIEMAAKWSSMMAVGFNS